MWTEAVMVHFKMSSQYLLIICAKHISRNNHEIIYSPYMRDAPDNLAKLCVPSSEANYFRTRQECE